MVRQLAIGILIVPGLLVLTAADWPQWRCDAARTANSLEELPDTLHVQWQRDLPPLKPAWPDEPRQQADEIHEPIVAGQTLFVGSSASDSLSAYDTRTGELRWRFFADGPVRYAPVASADRVYFGADDGRLYCLEATTGRLVWKQRIVPSPGRCIGHERIISRWPISTGPVLADGVLYCTAGIWPSDGVFLVAVDIRSGEPLWLQDAGGSTYQTHPHEGALSFSGPTPQGYLALSTDAVLVPCGRAAPAVFDRQSGRLRFFRAAENKTNGGGTRLAVSGDLLFCDGGIFELSTGNCLAAKYELPVIDGPYVIDGQGGRELSSMRTKPQSSLFWKYGAPDTTVRVHLKAGNRVYTSRESRLIVWQLTGANTDPVPAGSVDLQSSIERIITADERLFVVTQDGKLSCLGSETGGYAITTASPSIAESFDKQDEWSRRVALLLEQTDTEAGVCVVLGIGTGRLIEELVRQSNSHVLVVDDDPSAINGLRRRYDSLGLYGARVAATEGLGDIAHLPPHCASLVVCEESAVKAAGEVHTWVPRLSRRLRPYGGTAILFGEEAQQSVAAIAAAARHAGLEADISSERIMLRRTGALPGVDDWTHERGSAGNGNSSGDRCVKPPLGVLWYGGPAGGNLYFDRHSNPVPPLVAGGRMFVQGFEKLTAIDVYTGRLLWQSPLPPSENGYPWASTSDRLYVLCGSLIVLDARTGETIDCDRFPAGIAEFRIEGRLLVAAVDNGLVAHDRMNGERVWSCTLETPVRSLAVGTDRVFALAGPRAEETDAARRRGNSPLGSARLVALRLSDGTSHWQREASLTDHSLAYSNHRDLLLVAGEQARVAAHIGRDGQLQWEATLGWPCMLLESCLLSQDGAYDWETGRPRMRTDLTGADLPLTFARTYGCNRASAAPHLVTFRSGTGGYFDLGGDGGTANLGGFRTGCTNSLVAANGVLLAPKFAQGCSCAYPLYTALAFTHDPAAELWTTNSYAAGAGRIQRIGINLGAPGDRRDEQGVLWLDYPSVGGPSPELPIATLPSRATSFRQHSLQVEGVGHRWVGASGLEGLHELRVRLVGDPAAPSAGVTIASGDDDAEEYPNGEVNLTSSDVELIQEDHPQLVGLRFQALPLPQGQKVTEAHLQFTVDETSDENTSLVIQAHAADDAPRLTASPHDLSRRSRTEAKVFWRVNPWLTVGESGSAQQTPNLAPVLNELTSRPGWKPGNSVVILVSGEGKRVADSFDGGQTTGGTNTAAKLVWRTEGDATDTNGEQATASQVPPANYTVRLFFYEPRGLQVGERVFDVDVQGKNVLRAFDIVRAAGGPNRVVVKEVPHVPVADDVSVRLTPLRGLPILCGLELLIETDSR